VGELTFRLRGATEGVTTRIDGTVLTITAAPGAVKGSTLPLEVTPSDAVSEGKAGTVLIGIVPSTRPLAVPQSDMATVRRGSAVEVDVLANDQATNPFPATPLRVIDVRGTDTADLPDGVTVLPSPDKSRLNVVVAESARAADVTLQYEVADATNDPDRYAWGVVTISIQDVPDAPTVPVRAAGFVNATSQALVIFTSAPTRAPSRAPVPQKSPSSSPGNGLGVGAIAGLAIMLILVSVALCVCVFYFFFRKSLPTGHPGTSSRIDSAESGTRNSFSKSNSQDDKVILEINALTYDSAYARSDEFVSFESPSKRPASSRLNVMVPSPTDCTAVELAPLSTGDIAV
jgi:hypothetical protein